MSNDDDYEFSVEADTKRLMETAEKQATWFTPVSLGLLGVIYLISVWRDEDPLLILVIGVGVMVGWVGAEVLRTKALILRIEFLRMRLLRVQQERNLEMFKLERELADARAERAAQNDKPD